MEEKEQKQNKILENLEEKVLDFVRQHRLFQPGDKILAGVSGGPDSVCLFFVLLKIRERFAGNLHLEVLHVNHMLRGTEAQEDMEFVKKLCQEQKIAFHGAYFDVKAFAAENGCSTEEAGRILRYLELERVQKEQKLDKIAVAHHMDDHAETILMNLLRGSGLRGMVGIAPERGRIIRPLLGCSRAEIEQYLEQNQIAFRTDSTNLETVYTRNRVRREIVPVLTRINTKAVEHIAQFGMLAGEVDDYFQKKAQILFDKFGKTKENKVILCLDCRKEEKIELFYLLRYAIASLEPGLKDISKNHIEQLFELLDGKTGGKAVLPRQIIVEKGYQTMVIRKRLREESAQADATTGHAREQEPVIVSRELLEQKKSAVYTFSGVKFMFSIKKMKKNESFPKKKYTKWFDYDKIKFVLQIRNREPGDRIALFSDGRSKKLKDYFIDAKIPVRQRDVWPLVADGSQIVWIAGGRMSESYKIDSETVTVLEISCCGDGTKKDEEYKINWRNGEEATEDKDGRGKIDEAAVYRRAD